MQNCSVQLFDILELIAKLHMWFLWNFSASVDNNNGDKLPSHSATRGLDFGEIFLSMFILIMAIIYTEYTGQYFLPAWHPLFVQGVRKNHLLKLGETFCTWKFTTGFFFTDFCKTPTNGFAGFLSLGKKSLSLDKNSSV